MANTIFCKFEQNTLSSRKKMRLFILIVLGFTFSGLNLAPLPLSTDLEKGLVAHFNFNHCDARDDSGHNNMGELKGNVQCWCGVEDDGLLLDGKNAHILFSGPMNQVFASSDFSLSLYFKSQSRSFFPQTLASKRAACTDENMLDLLLNYSLGQVDTEFKESEFKFFKELTPEFKQDTWMHFTLVREGFYARIFINGFLVKESRRCSGIDLTNPAPFSIGDSPCVYGGRVQRFQGIIDELRVYDRALNEEEVLQIYQLTPIENAEMDCYS